MRDYLRRLVTGLASTGGLPQKAFLFVSLTRRTGELSLYGSQLAGWRKAVVVKGCGRGRPETVGSARGR